eukprot:CAMPEP_0114575182 /NCGR_PEP_ID=MMETSP0125-20121206/84_1 /TAXON_ID=485358 ORGANISM="Aristerostoma sp., Strain ATCC 50986" /NCGR_SAMPLE_ID=MMETSP0125 /ASSEMBLY_ACC=CAM_ASM_000245 /LENGTH=52 /DNA_ID=CAMNT_0001762721 /DNA_START=1062 /DNA_END=1220 /DNA_ORIENTATION=+
MSDLRLVQTLNGSSDSVFFEVIIKNYLIKMPKSRTDFDNSGIVCGKLTNMIL